VSAPLAVVVIPTFNEAENIKILLPKLLELPVDILVVDDASKDGTEQVVLKFCDESGRVTLLSRPKKLGLGSAYRDGFARVLTRDYQWIIQMDADGSHRVDDLRQMLDFQRSNPQYDLIIGSRWVDGGAVANWPKKREVLSRVANYYSRKLLGIRVRDNTAGFRIYHAQLLRRMALAAIKSEGYAFQIEMTRAAVHVNAQIAEVPILFVEREHGVSKMSGRIIREALFKVTKWGLTRLVTRRTWDR
jgi:dolichol-phosphate mannosyltransferase